MTNNLHPNTSTMARTYIAGTTPDHAILAPLVPVMATRNGDGHVRCSCTWGDSGERGMLRLRMYHFGCQVWQSGGHE